MTLQILTPHGFCAGVTGALRCALSLPKGVYCLHELVHNELVVSDLVARGFTFVESLSEVPAGETVLFSAHGVSPAVRQEAVARGLHIIDATCPFVTRVHRAAADFAARGLQVVILGNPAHVEVQGILGEAPAAKIVPSQEAAQALDWPRTTRLGVVSQTTMNADVVAELVATLRARFDLETLAEVCNATKERQDAVKTFAGDALLVLGSANSSNTRRLCEVAPCRTFRAGTLAEVQALDFSGVQTLGITSGASTPENYFEDVVKYLYENYT